MVTSFAEKPHTHAASLARFATPREWPARYGDFKSTNRPIARKDGNDSVYKTRREKYGAVIKEIKEIHSLGRPILVGTISVEVSEP